MCCPQVVQLAWKYSPIARRMTSETLTCSWAARSSRARFSSGSSRTDSTEAAAEPSGGRPPPPAAQQRVHVVAPLGLLGHRLDVGVRDRRAVFVLSVVHFCSRLSFGSSRRATR